MISEYNSIKEKLKSSLKESRYIHTIGVAYTAASLAMCYGQDMDKAFLAGLLHDCAKNISASESIALCDNYNVTISPAEEKNPELLHAKLGAIIAKLEYKVEEEDILNAIRLHTTGAPAMTTLEKIIYIADYIEPSRRDIPGLSNARRIAYCSLDQAMEKITGNVLSYLQSISAEIDDMTLKTHQYYKNLNQNSNCQREEK